MEKTTIVLSRNTVNELCRRKIKIGDTYDTVIKNLINEDKKFINNGKI